MLLSDFVEIRDRVHEKVEEIAEKFLLKNNIAFHFINEVEIDEHRVLIEYYLPKTGSPEDDKKKYYKKMYSHELAGIDL